MEVGGTVSRELLYTGSSMNPQFLLGDTLLIAPYDSKSVRPGDVVVFSSPKSKKLTVHRVATVSPEGLTTKGDNNPGLDNWVLSPQDILGQVVGIRRKGLILPVPRDLPAKVYLLRGHHKIDWVVSKLFHSLYHRLAQSELLQGRLSAWVKPRLLCFFRLQGLEWQLWLGRLLIGRKLPTQSSWNIRRPFRLIVDDTSLP